MSQINSELQNQLHEDPNAPVDVGKAFKKVFGDIPRVEPKDLIASRRKLMEEAQKRLEAARKILEPLRECDPAVREWLGEPRFQSGE